MKTNSCKSCLFCIPLQNAASILICTNRQNAAGLLFKAGKEHNCRNFRLKDKKPSRPAVTQPAGSAVRLIPLTQGKVAIVDAEDYDWLSRYKWHTNKKAAGFYAATHIGPKLIYMHREIMKYKLSATRSTLSATRSTLSATRYLSAEVLTKADTLSATSSTLSATRSTLSANLVVDHIDRHSLNNTKANLRTCTNTQNHYNQRPRGGSSRYKGVSWYRTTKKWAAAIEKNNKQFHLGYFKNETDAARAYDAKAKELFGRFAYLNFPEQ